MRLQASALVVLLFLSPVVMLLGSAAPVMAVGSADVDTWYNTNATNTYVVGGAITESYYFTVSGTTATQLVSAQSLTNGNTTIATSSTNTGGGISPVVAREVYPISSNCVVWVGSTTTIQHACVSGTAMNTASSTFGTSISCTAVSVGRVTDIGDYVVVPCTDEGIGLITKGSLSASKLTGLTSGSITCTTLDSVRMLTLAKGVALCDSTELVSFTVSGSTITTIDSVTLSVSSANKRAVVTSVSSTVAYLYVYDYINGAIVEGVRINPSSMMFTSDGMALAGVTDGLAVMVMSNGNRVVVYDRDSVQLFVYDAKVIPSSAYVDLIGISDVDILNGSPTAQQIPTSYDGVTIFMGKGQPGTESPTGRYHIISSLVADGVAFVINSGDGDGFGGTGSSAPGSFGSEFCRDTTGDGLYDTCLTVRDAPVGMYCTDPDGDGVFDNCNRTTGPITTTGPALVGLFTGITGEGANVLLGMIAPMAFLLLAGATAATGKVQLPMFVFGIAFLGGIGVSVSIGWLESWWVVIGIMGFATSFAGEIKKIFG